jgi:hypothetical protein
VLAPRCAVRARDHQASGALGADPPFAEVRRKWLEQINTTVPPASALAPALQAREILVRRGVRPGGLAPPGARTRFTWSAA